MEKNLKRMTSSILLHLKKWSFCCCGNVEPEHKFTRDWFNQEPQQKCDEPSADDSAIIKGAVERFDPYHNDGGLFSPVMDSWTHSIATDSRLTPGTPGLIRSALSRGSEWSTTQHRQHRARKQTSMSKSFVIVSGHSGGHNQCGYIQHFIVSVSNPTCRRPLKTLWFIYLVGKALLTISNCRKCNISNL